jgi:type IX secretion system PorP/SprF family membrane protein
MANLLFCLKKTFNMKKILVSVFLLFITADYAQELNLPVFTQYLADNQFVVSPTFAGIGDNMRIRANGLTQWVGIKNAPDNQSLYADFRIADRSGIGLSFYNDKNGFTKQTGAKISFAHHLVLDYYSKQYLSFGLSYNINNFKIDISKFDPTIIDPSVTDERAVSNNNFDAGALYRLNNFYVSLNVNNILNKKIDIYRGVEPSLLRNFQLYTGYVIKSESNSRLEYEPSVFYQYFQSDKRSSTDINVKARYYDSNDGYYWGGISYRFLNDQIFQPLNVGPMVGLKKSNIYVGYSYQTILNELRSFNSGTHVITIGFDLFQGVSNCPCSQSPVHD